MGGDQGKKVKKKGEIRCRESSLFERGWVGVVDKCERSPSMAGFKVVM